MVSVCISNDNPYHALTMIARGMYAFILWWGVVKVYMECRQIVNKHH